jgi:pimeloyl-ACP methyl ester carboxylesterase
VRGCRLLRSVSVIYEVVEQADRLSRGVVDMMFTKRAAGTSIWARLVALVVGLCLAAACTAEGGTEPGEPVEGSARFDPAFRHGTVAVEGGSVHYVSGGQGPPIVLIHGWPQTWWEWHKVMPDLARDHTVIAVDLPGLGDSTAPADGYDKATTARRVHEAVQRLGFTQVEVLAHDVGSMVGYAYARDFPDAVTRLAVLEAPLPGFGLEGFYGVSWHFLFNASAAPTAETILDDDDVEAYLGHLYDLGSRHPGAVDREVSFRAYADPADRSAGYEYYRALAADAEDFRAQAESRRLSIPVLAIGAQNSFGSGVAESFRGVADDVREVVAPDSGHWIPEENPRFVIDCVRLFLGDGAQQINDEATRPELAGCRP